MLRSLGILLVGAAMGALGAFAYHHSQGRWTGDSSTGPPASDGRFVGHPLTGHPLTGHPLTGQPLTSYPRNGQPPARRSIMALGTLEPRDGILRLGSPLVGYRIARVHVREGQVVQAGDLLIELDATGAETELQLALARQAEAVERWQSEISLAKQRVASAELAVQQTTQGKQLQLDAQRSRLDVAASRVSQAEKDVEHFERLRKLSEPLASQQQVEQQRAVRDAAAAERESAEIALQQLEQSLRFREQSVTAESRAARESLELAERGTGLESLRQNVELAQHKRAQTMVTAPTAGVVLHVMVHPGEIVAQQPMLQLANLDSLVCVAEVDAVDVPSIAVGHQALVSSRALQDTVLEGRVDRVGNLVSQAMLRPLDPRQPVDRTVAKVVISIDAGQVASLLQATAGDRMAALIGLQVEVAFPL